MRIYLALIISLDAISFLLGSIDFQHKMRLKINKEVKTFKLYFVLILQKALICIFKVRVKQFSILMDISKYLTNQRLQKESAHG